MSALPPSWAMGSMGIDGTGDAHLAKGVHLRVFTAPPIGLPIRPFTIYRLDGDIAQRQLAGKIRTEMTWVDGSGAVLTLPFEVTAKNPVTGYITRPIGVRAIAVGITIGKAEQPATGRPRRPADAGDGKLVMDAFLDTPQGRRLVGRRESDAYVLAAPDIHGIVLSGEGTVRSAWWVQDDVSIVEKLRPTMLLDMPVATAARYEGLPDAKQRAEKRVRAGAPGRFGLHDDPSVSGPAAAALATDNDEWKRVEALAKEIFPHLDKVLNDTSALPAALMMLQLLSDGVKPGAFAEAQIASLRAVLAGTADPGVAKWLGFSVVDDDPSALATAMTLYLVRGFVAVDLDKLDPVQRLTLIVSGGILTADLISPHLPFKVPKLSKDGLPVFDFTVPVVVFPGAPPARPQSPGIGAPLSPSVLVGPKGTTPPATSDGQGPWLAEFIPPDARREVVLPLTGLSAAPSLAGARRQGSTLTSLNDRHPDTGRALALVPAVPENALVTGTGRLADRAAPPSSVTYRIAQADWFGRWSEWAESSVGPKTRPLPPAPVFNVHYQLAAATPVNNTPRFGTLRVRLRVPRPEDLAPGSRLLVSARVEAVIGGVTVNVTGSVTSPTQGFLDIVVPGPSGMIARAGRVTALIKARWNDGVIDGPLSEPVERILVDPRPPAALVMDPTLRYSARPDAVGRARVVLDWNAVAGVRYRIYTTDETRLRGALQELADGGNAIAQALLQELATAPTAAHRGQAYTQPSRASLFTRGLFNNLTAEPLVPLSPGPIRFSYDLSGSLTVLAFFKIVAVSQDNVESPFTDATLLPVAVPSGGPPPRPLLDFLGWTDAGDARLRVTSIRGPQPVVRWRLRRSFAESSDALRMPIIAEGTVPGMVGEGPAVFEIEDAGVDALAGGSLPPWTRMSWRVEVQAPSPAGSTLPGEWSAASAAVGGMRVPPTPVAVTDLTIDGVVGDAVTLAWKHPDALQKGSQGGYRFDVYRRDPGKSEKPAGFVLADDAAAVTGTGAARTIHYTDDVPSPVGTTWRVVTLDPVGRLSPPSNFVTRS